MPTAAEEISMNIRKAALNILVSVERDGAYSALAINNSVKENKLNKLDASFLSALVYGVLERQILLDYIISQYSKIPLKKIELKTKIILRLGVLQLLFMDKIPDSAAVNESVNLSKKCGLVKSSGFINGILRSVTRAETKYRLPDETDAESFLSVKYSCPREIVSLWLSSYGYENTLTVLKSLSGRPQLTARVNTLKTDSDSLIDELRSEGVNAEKSPLDENALVLTNTGSIESLKAYGEGKLYIQDLSSQLCVKVLDPQPGDVMTDVCAAPGGKTFTAALRMNNIGKISAFDVFEHKLRLIDNTSKRLSITCVQTALRDAEKDTRELEPADRVLCDVPCSGLGIINRKPEIRYKKNLLNTDLPELQYRILCNSARFTAVGGTLVYSTCTLNPAENGQNAQRFLDEHEDFEPVPIDLGVKRLIDEPSNMLTLFPGANPTDGFFISAFRKKR